MGKIMTGESKAVVDLMAFVEDTERTSTKDQMLVQLERVIKSQNIKVLVIEVSQHRLDIQEWLKQCGYEELGGHASTNENYIKPTMIFEFHKDLTKPSKVASRAPSGSSNTALGDTQRYLEENLQDLQPNSDDFEILSTVSSEAPRAHWGSISELFTALHKEQPSSE